MDNLNKQQVILIALLVAIVTSITTGIVTVSLSDQSSSGVSQTIYRVVEKTIANVTPADSPVRKIVEKEDNPKISATLSITEIAEKNGKNLVRIFAGLRGSGEKRFVGVGIALTSKGFILGSGLPLEWENSNFWALNSLDQEIPISVKKNLSVGALPVFSVNDNKDISKLTPETLGSISSLKLGSSAISFGGKEKDNVVSTGIVTEFENLEGNTSTSTTNIAITDMKISSRYTGFLLINTLGNIIGFALPLEENRPAKFIDAGLVRKEIESIQ